MEFARPSKQQLRENESNKIQLLTPSQAAKAMAISERKLWGMTNSGDIPHLKIGRSVRYPIDDLQQWINDQIKGGELS